MRMLNLSGNQLSTQMAKALENCLKHNSYLRALILQDN